MNVFSLGVIGLGTMGANLARNAARNGAQVAVFNRTGKRTEEFMEAHRSEGEFIPCATLTDLCEALRPPRTIILMVNAGSPVDAVLRELLPHLAEGDSVVDGGNSHYEDTERRQKKSKKDKNVSFLGMGVSGGETGALNGPSMMIGGDRAAYQILEPLFLKMAADDGAGGKCVAWLGEGGSGHFVKMVHNGIEYGLMQIIAECYDLLRSEEDMAHEELAQIFAGWSQSEQLRSFLLEVTAAVLQKKDEESGEWLVNLIRDGASQKGTGKWTVEAALEFGTPIPTTAAAVDARILSSLTEKRAKFSKDFPVQLPEPYSESKQIPLVIESALELSMLCTYTQGFELLQAASDAQEWNLPLAEIARIWRGGCIIRSAALPYFQDSFSSEEAKSQQAKAALLDRFRDERQIDWRRLIAIATGRGVPVPALSASLAYYDTLRNPSLPQNLIQAQRDFFGAHEYERKDRAGTFHTNWLP